MTNLNNVLDVIKEIECPVDQWQAKVIEAYKEYASDDDYEIGIIRDESLDSEDAKAYVVHSSDSEAKEIVVCVNEGVDHYVANVYDAYIR